MKTDARILHRGSDRYLLVRRGAEACGEHLTFPDRERARLFLSQLAAEPGNRETLRAASKDLHGVPGKTGGRPDEDEFAPLSDALARDSMEIVRLIDHTIGRCQITTTGALTLSEVSWGETSSLYPSNTHRYQPDLWDANKLYDLQKARAAITDVGRRNGQVRKAKPSSGNIDQLMRPYHCLENFPTKDAEIDEDVKWFYLSASGSTPTSHPGTTGTTLARSYGPFFNAGGGDASRGDCWLHFYKIG
jgi:hypothetical protein